LIFGVPEYNYSVSAPLKNFIDWCNRGEENCFSNKFVGLVSAGGRLGGARAQYHLR
jgi:chromate reductase